MKAYGTTSFGNMNQSNSKSPNEKMLVVRAQARDEESFQRLVIEYERRMLYYIHRLLGRDADLADVMQEIWIRVFQRITTLRAPEAFRVWLYKIAHDVAVSHLRKTQRREFIHLEDVHIAEQAAARDWNECDWLENAEWVHKALERLSLPHREVLTLRFLEELDLAEIAEIVGCNMGTVKSRLHYAKSAMRELLETNGHD
jgi:RNA polymerase sigma-70 factor (ECF subfamily)